MSDSSMAIASNTQRYAGGINMNGRWADMITKAPEEEDPRSCVEITHGIWSRIRGEKK